MHALGLLTGLIQAYIFAILALVYIASATRAHQDPEEATTERQPVADKPTPELLERGDR
jgi:F-type H+-transporting ATPase subunit a